MQSACRGLLKSKHSWLGYRVFERRTNYRKVLERTLSSGSEISDNNVKVPSSSQVVVCGGGIIGCSVVYHLAKSGWTDVILLEQGRLSCGTSWHAASLIGALKNSSAETQLANYGCQLYSHLEEETGLGTGWKQCGSILVARTKDRMTYLKRQYGKARAFGIECEFISPSDVAVKWENVRIDDILGALWFPNDGVAMSTDICQSLARGATMNVIDAQMTSQRGKNKKVAHETQSSGSLMFLPRCDVPCASITEQTTKKWNLSVLYNKNLKGLCRNLAGFWGMKKEKSKSADVI